MNALRDEVEEFRRVPAMDFTVADYYEVRNLFGWDFRFFKLLSRCLLHREEDLALRLCLAPEMRSVVRDRWPLFCYGSPTLESARNGLFSLLVYFHKFCGISANQSRFNCDSTLHHAASSGSVGIVRYLVEHCGVDPHLVLETGVTAVHSAARNGHLGVIKYLVDVHKVDVQTIDKRHRSALFIAIYMGYLEVTKYFYYTGKFDFFQRQARVRDQTLLEISCLSGNTGLVSFLFEETGIRELFEQGSVEINGVLVSSLKIAAKHGHNDIFRYLFSAMSREKVEELTEASELIRICRSALSTKRHDGARIVNFLLKNISYMDSRVYSKICSHLVEMDHVFFLTHFYREYGEDFLLPDSHTGHTPLHVASTFFSLKCFTFLIDKCNMSPYARNREGNSILHSCVVSEHITNSSSHLLCIGNIVERAPGLVLFKNNRNMTPRDLSNYNRDPQLQHDMLWHLGNYARKFTDPYSIFEGSDESQTFGFTKDEVMVYIQLLQEKRVRILPTDVAWYGQLSGVVRTRQPELPPRQPKDTCHVLWRLAGKSGDLMPLYQEPVLLFSSKEAFHYLRLCSKVKLKSLSKAGPAIYIKFSEITQKSRPEFPKRSMGDIQQILWRATDDTGDVDTYLKKLTPAPQPPKTSHTQPQKRPKTQ